MISGQKKGKQYLLFKLEDKYFGTRIDDVKRILSLDYVHKVPLMKENFEGLMRYEDKAVPLFNLKKSLGFKGGVTFDESFVAIESVDGCDVGFIIGDVITVIRIDEEHLKNSSGNVPGVRMETQWEDNIVYLLNADELVSAITN